MAEVLHIKDCLKSEWQTGKKSSTKTEPDPVVCPHCGAVRRYERRTIPQLGFVTWVAPGPCQCSGAKKERAEEEARRKAAWEQEKILARRKRYAELLRKSRLPKRYSGLFFKDAKITEQNRKAFEIARKYIEAFSRGEQSQSLFITGPVGTGKTYLVSCLVNELLYQGICCLFGNVLNLLGRIKQSYDDATEEDEQAVLQQLKTVPLLVIDDLGKEKVSPWVQQILYDLIDTRYAEERAVVITSNFTLSELEKRYDEDVGPALASRLAQMCIFINLCGEDLRKRIGRGEKK